jgi:hypothetical protein
MNRRDQTGPTGPNRAKGGSGGDQGPMSLNESQKYCAASLVSFPFGPADTKRYIIDGWKEVPCKAVQSRPAWDQRCLDFHRTERAVRTSSAAQVRRPIYASSIGRRHAYGPLLEPLLAELSPLVM